MPLHHEKKRPGILRTLIEIYSPLLLFGGISAGYSLWKSGPDALLASWGRFLEKPLEYLGPLICAGICLLLTPVLIALMRAQQKNEAASSSSEGLTDLAETEDERFPQLNYRLPSVRKAGAPQPVQKVIIPQTVPASSASQSAERLRLMLGDHREMEIPLAPGIHKTQVKGFTITVSVASGEGTILEDITRELPLQQ